jgi:hypothetical protein
LPVRHRRYRWSGEVERSSGQPLHRHLLDLFDEICQGCGRTAAEVSNWVFYSDEEKQVIWERITREGTARRFQPD